MAEEATLETVSDPQQSESKESTSTQQPVHAVPSNEPQKPESEEATSTQQPSEPQQPESDVATSMAESSENIINEPQQAESGTEAVGSQIRVQPEVDDCPFCRIVVELTPANIVYKDDDFVCFSDRSPVATCHFLLVPRKHLRDVRSLTVEHIPMLTRMVEVAKVVLTEQHGDLDDARMGFHLAPFLRVSHLHMHIISPASRMSWLNRNIVFRNDSFAFISPTGAINNIKKASNK